MTCPVPGHAQQIKVDVGKGSRGTTEKIGRPSSITVSASCCLLTNFEGSAVMKRLTEWINLITAIVRLIDVIIRTGRV